jgi:DNA-binding CsgD family transcriptional regulator/PAS domain-containing protein
VTFIDGVSLEALSDTISAIYDGALDAGEWTNAVRKVADLCDSALGGFSVTDLTSFHTRDLGQTGFKQDFWKAYEPSALGNPQNIGVELMNVGQVGTLAMLCSDQEFLGSRCFQASFAPRGLGLCTGTRIVGLHACRDLSEQRFAAREVGIFELLSTHLCRALTIADAIDVKTLECERLEASLDALTAGVWLLAGDGRVVHMNRTAERQAREGRALEIVSGRLRLHDPAAHDTLQRSVTEADRDVTAARLGAHAIAVPGAGGAAGYIATLLPLTRGRRRTVWAAYGASLAVFMQDPTLVAPFPGEAFARLYGLTGGELRVVLALAQGLSATESAAFLGLAERTVRSHLQRVFAKTGTSRQTQLLQLLHAATPPARPGAQP